MKVWLDGWRILDDGKLSSPTRFVIAKVISWSKAAEGNSSSGFRYYSDVVSVEVGDDNTLYWKGTVEEFTDIVEKFYDRSASNRLQRTN